MATSVVSEESCGIHPVRRSMPCRACRSPLRVVELDSYATCASCGSANYIPTRSAEADNSSYFDDIYSDTMRHPIENRYRHFVTWENIYSTIREKERDKFRAILDRMSKRIIAAGTSVEIGFGSGHELASYLRAGANMYGVDMSHEAVSRFKSSHPEFSTRVSWGSKTLSPVDVLYCNALFEHLDDPAAFLEEAVSCLNPGGTLLMRLPVITANVYTPKQTQSDINFWKPCHRILYTYKGLDTLLKSHGFEIIESAPLAYYGYKVMSAMLRYGFHDVTTVRNPYFPIKGLDSDRRYLMILIESLFRKLICSDFAVVIGKVR